MTYSFISKRYLTLLLNKIIKVHHKPYKETTNVMTVLKIGIVRSEFVWCTISLFSIAKSQVFKSPGSFVIPKFENLSRSIENLCISINAVTEFTCIIDSTMTCLFDVWQLFLHLKEHSTVYLRNVVSHVALHMPWSLKLRWYKIKN